MSLPNLLPPLSIEEFDNLKTSMQEQGFLPEFPIIKDENGVILDGHHRAQAAEELGIEPVVVVKRGLADWDKVVLAVSVNTSRRHLTATARQDLLRRLMDVHDEVLKAEAEEARKAGNSKGGKSSPSATRLDEGGLRAAAAEATKQPFNGPVTTSPKPKVDRLETYGKMLGVSRATVARDKQAIERIERIEEAATEAGRTDITEALDRKGADLAGFEFELGLRVPDATEIPRAVVAEDREAELDLLAAAVAANNYKQFSTADARSIIEKSGLASGAILVTLMNVIKAVREVEKNG